MHAEENLKKEISVERKEFKMVKEENAKLNSAISNMQCKKDTLEAKSKAD